MVLLEQEVLILLVFDVEVAHFSEAQNVDSISFELHQRLLLVQIAIVALLVQVNFVAKVFKFKLLLVFQASCHLQNDGADTEDFDAFHFFLHAVLLVLDFVHIVAFIESLLKLFGLFENQLLVFVVRFAQTVGNLKLEPLSDDRVVASLREDLQVLLVSFLNVHRSLSETILLLEERGNLDRCVR